jgi:hypothetical protein
MWCYRKRLHAVEASQDSNELVIREFGSVQEGLIEFRFFQKTTTVSEGKGLKCVTMRIFDDGK